MIKTLIFDFGNVFINLDIENAILETFKTLEIENFSKDIIKTNNMYEIGKISTKDFIQFYSEKFPKVSKNDLIDLWNFMLKDFPEYRLNFLKTLKKDYNYKLILLSNTNELHINWIKENVSFYEEFKNLFDVFYLSHEINLRKPNKDIFEFVLNNNNLNPSECLFIDDNYDNIITASTLEIKTWHITPNKEDVINLFKTKSKLF